METVIHTSAGASGWVSLLGVLSTVLAVLGVAGVAYLIAEERTVYSPNVLQKKNIGLVLGSLAITIGSLTLASLIVQDERTHNNNARLIDKGIEKVTAGLELSASDKAQIAELSDEFRYLSNNESEAIDLNEGKLTLIKLEDNHQAIVEFEPKKSEENK